MRLLLTGLIILTATSSMAVTIKKDRLLPKEERDLVIQRILEEYPDAQKIEMTHVFESNPYHRLECQVGNKVYQVPMASVKKGNDQAFNKIAFKDKAFMKYNLDKKRCAIGDNPKDPTSYTKGTMTISDSWSNLHYSYKVTLKDWVLGEETIYNADYINRREEVAQ